MGRSRSGRRLLAALCAFVAPTLAFTPAAFGHAALVGASPAPGDRVAQAPGRIVLVFSEPLSTRLSTARLESSGAGAGTVAATVSIRGRRLTLTPGARLPRGAYAVRWRTVSTGDAHPLEGTVGFGVRARPAASGAVEASPLAGTGWLRALARAGLYAALLLLAGGLLARALLGPAFPARAGGGEPDGTVRERANELLVDAALATVSLGAVVAAVDAAGAADELSAGALQDYLLGSVPGAARVALVALAAVALALVRRAPRAAALTAAAAVGCVAVSGHARSASVPGLAIPSDWAHLLAGAVWLGGAALIVLAWGPALRDRATRSAVAHEVLPRFGRVALPAFAVVAVAGTVNAVVELERVSDLWRTSYGGVLAAKVAIVLAAAVAAAVHALWLRPRLAAPAADSGGATVRTERRHWRALRGEAALALGVVAAAGVLVAFPLPPRQLDAATRDVAPVVACDPCPLPGPAPGELSVADQAGTRLVAAWARPAGGGVTGTVRVLDFRGRPARGPVAVAGGRTRPCGRGCAEFSRPGRARALEVAVIERGRGHRVALPVEWERGRAARARRLLERAERTMRSLRSVREFERTRSGPGMTAVTRYVLRAPDRLAYATDGGVRTIQIGSRQWRRVRGGPWIAGPVPGGAPFRTRAWFRWTPYARAVELLGERRAGRRRVAELALMDPGTPVWVRLRVDVASGRVTHERLVAPARLIEHRFGAFDRPVDVSPPRRFVDGG
jgi:copper transport protein